MRGWVAMQMLGENVVGTVLEMGQAPAPAGRPAAACWGCRGRRVL